jgi:hypothetical protein
MNSKSENSKNNENIVSMKFVLSTQSIPERIDIQRGFSQLQSFLLVLCFERLLELTIKKF